MMACSRAATRARPAINSPKPESRADLHLVLARRAVSIRRTLRQTIRSRRSKKPARKAGRTLKRAGLPRLVPGRHCAGGSRSLKVRIPHLFIFLLPRFFEGNAADAAVALCNVQGAPGVILGPRFLGYLPAKGERLAVVGQHNAAELLAVGAVVSDSEV
jgi:hypothetical protein